MPTTPTLWGSKAQVDYDASGGTQSAQQILGLSNGNSLAVYADSGSATGDGTGTDIVGVIYDAEGGIVRDAFQVNTGWEDGDEGQPALAASNDGGFYMAYESDTGSEQAIRVERFDANGDTLSQATVQSDPGSPVLSAPSIAVDPRTNGVFVSYQWTDGDESSVRGKLFDADLAVAADTPADGQVLQADAAPDDASVGATLGETALLTSGDFVTVYREDGPDPAIGVRGSDGSTGANGFQFEIDGTGSDGLADSDPQVATLAGGGFVVVWQQEDGDADNLRYAVYDNSGAEVVAPATVVDTEDAYAAPDVVGLANGGFFVVTENETQGAIEGAGIDNSEDTPSSPELDLTSDGRLLISWQTASGEVQKAVWDPRGDTIMATGTETVITARATQATEIIGSSVGETILGQDYDDTIRGHGGKDTIRGGAGDDLLLGGDGADNLDGGPGSDMLFGDLTQAGTVLDTGGDVFRLYQATLDRAPDAKGHLNWTEQLQGGNATLPEVADGFINSQEFQETYGTLEDKGFVTQLYNNVLDRAPDSGGLDTWLGRMDDGMARRDVLLGFSQSDEFKSLTAEAATAATAQDAAGLIAESEWSGAVYRMYRAVLDRAPDAKGHHHWVEELGDGAELSTVTHGFVASQEFQQVYGDLTDGEFVNLLYQNVLDRDADAGGLDHWLGELDAGATRSDVVVGFSESPEFQAKTAPALKAWMTDLGPDDTLSDSGDGDAVFYGGYGRDTFVFEADGGETRVLDAEAWDRLSFEGFGYTDTDQVAAHLTETGSGEVVFDDQGTTVVFHDATSAEITGMDTLLG